MTVPAPPHITAAVADESLPALSSAVAWERADREVGRVVRPLLPSRADMRLCDVRVLAHKAGRRCVIAYDFRAVDAGDEIVLGVIGKIRARKRADRGYSRLLSVWSAGFDADSPDGISVPQPIGLVPAFDMWLQRRVRGVTFTRMLLDGSAVAFAARIAEAAHKLHAAGVLAAVRHTIADELAILDRCFAEVAASIPALSGVLFRVQRACERVGAMLPEPAWAGSHRDFYSDQVIVDRDGRLFLIDFDLYCEADPGLDIGNFLGHVTEFSLRCCGEAAALAGVEQALSTRFRELAGDAASQAARAYAALTVARHVYLSTRFEERRATTNALLAIAERRLQELAAEGGHA